MFLFFGRISLPYYERPEWGIGHFDIVAISGTETWGWPDNYRILSDGDKLEYDELIELWVYVDSFGSQYGHAVGRTLYRDGERIRLVYISRTETPFSLMRRRFWAARLATQEFRSRMDALQDIGHGQQTIEVYYLQSLYRQRRRIESLSDADFDALRADGSFVWRGTIGIPE